MTIDGPTEKRLTRPTATVPLPLIENAGELTINGPGRLHMLFDAQIANTGRVILLPSANVMGNRCCIAPVSGIIGTGSVTLQSGILPLPPPQAVLANMALETPGPITAAAGSELILDGGEHKLADGIHIQGGGKMTLTHARAGATRIDLAADTTLEIADRSVLAGKVRFGGTGPYRWTGGGFEGDLLVEQGARLGIAGVDRKTFGVPDGSRRGLLRNEGTVEWTDASDLFLGGSNAGSPRIENVGLLRLAGNERILANCCTNPSVLANTGTLERRGTAGDTVLSGIFIDNAGKIDIAQGRLSLQGGALFGQSAGLTLLQDGGALAAKSIDLRGGALHGGGRIEGALNNLAGEVAPGGMGATGTLSIAGDFTQGYAGTLLLEVGSPTVADVLEVSGAARLDGERRVVMLGGFNPAVGQDVEVARYGGRQGTFVRVSGLDLGPDLHLRARYQEAAINGPGSLHLQARAEAVPAECNAQSQTLDWSGSRDTVAQILGQSTTATDAFRAITGRYKVIETALASAGDLGITGRLVSDSDNRSLIVFQFAWPDIHSVFDLTSIFTHEMGHGRQALEQRFTSAEAAPFLTQDQYTTLRWWGEELAFRLQGTVLAEIADAVPDFERCRVMFLETDPRLQHLAAGETEPMRNQIVDDYPQSTLEQEWSRNAQVSPDELARLADVKARITTLLQTQTWQSQETIWQSRR
jgi:hypothetical protein